MNTTKEIIMITITIDKRYKIHVYEVRVDGKIRQKFCDERSANMYAHSLSCYLEVKEETKKPTAKKPSAKITASFSNGFTREYKGDRNVKAAWIIINKDTNETILSGFSMRTDLAYSSARNRRRECNELMHAITGCERYGYPYYAHDLRDRLFPSRKEERRLKRENKERLIQIDNRITIEIVDIIS